MTRHLFFWIGFFAAGLLVVPIAAGIMGAAEQELRRAAVIVFAVISGLVLALVLALVFRGWILRRVLGRSEATLSDVSASLIDGVAAASAGDRAAATAHAQALVQRGMGWYAWTNFYRWVIATAVALLLSFGAFVGTALLFEQNRKLGEQTEVLRVQGERLAEQTGFMQAQTELMQAQTDRLREQTEAAALQNEIIALNLVNQLRGQMLATVETRSLGGWLRLLGVAGIDAPLVRYASGGRSCALSFDFDYEMSSPPSAAALGAIEALTQTPSIGERVIDALELLALDRNGAVALGALIVLDRIGKAPTEDDVRINGVMMTEHVFLRDSSIRLSVRGSLAGNLICPNCSLHVTSSIFFVRAPFRMSGFGNILVSRSRPDRLNGITITYGPDDPDESQDDAVLLEAGPYFLEDDRAWLTQHEAEPTCDEFRNIARINPMLRLGSAD